MQTQGDFEAFLSAIDATLWTVDPLGNRQDQNLSVLIGRPLALVRARLQLQLNGPALTDTSWAATLNPPPADFLSNKFAIRIGDQAKRADGVIGYYTDDNYDSFNIVVAPGTTTAQNYVKQIGPPNGGTNYLELQFDPSSQALVCLLVDPRASIHATSGILPVKEIQIPSGFVDTALDNLEVSFHSGPLLTWLRAMPSQDGLTPPFAQAISVPMPAEQNGAWSGGSRMRLRATGMGTDCSTQFPMRNFKVLRKRLEKVSCNSYWMTTYFLQMNQGRLSNVMFRLDRIQRSNLASYHRKSNKVLDAFVQHGYIVYCSSSQNFHHTIRARPKRGWKFQ